MCSALPVANAPCLPVVDGCTRLRAAQLGRSCDRRCIRLCAGLWRKVTPSSRGLMAVSVLHAILVMRAVWFIDPGTLLLDATADIDGIVQLCSWRTPHAVP